MPAHIKASFGCELWSSSHDWVPKNYVQTMTGGPFCSKSPLARKQDCLRLLHYLEGNAKLEPPALSWVDYALFPGIFANVKVLGDLRNDEGYLG